EKFYRGRERIRELRKLTIDVNPYSLKGAGGRMLTLLARPDDARHEFGKFACGLDGPFRAASCNRLCNPESKPFFAMAFDNLPHCVNAGTRQPLRSRRTARRIHSHI